MFYRCPPYPHHQLPVDRPDLPQMSTDLGCLP